MYNNLILQSRSSSRHTPTPIPPLATLKGTILALLERAVREEADPQVIERLQWMLHFTEHSSVSETCAHFSISRSTFYRWLKRFDPADYNTLTDHPTRPGMEQRVPKSEVPKSESLIPNPEPHCPFCRLAKWLRAPSLKTIGTLLLVIVILNLALLLLVLPVSAGATGTSSWNPGLLVNTEAFQTIDDSDATANVQLKFGEGLQESLTYNRGTSQFEFTRPLLVHGNLTATGSLEILGTMSGKSLQVTGTGASPLIYTDQTTGRVGIGTTAPASLLHLKKSQAALTTLGDSRQLILDNTNGATNERLEIGLGYKGAGTYQPAVIGHQVIDQNGSTAGSLYFATRALTTDSAPLARLTIDSAGNVGIGTTAPNVKLSVAGTASGKILSFGDRLTGSGAVSIRTLTDSTTAFQVLDNDGGNPVFNIDTTNERVGIGTNAPETALETVGTVSGSALTVSNLLNCNTIDTDAAGNLVCGTDEGGVGGGLTAAQADNIFVNQGGDTMTGALKIRPTTLGEAELEVAGTASGKILSFGTRLTGSGSVTIRTLTDSTTAFQVLDNDGGNPVFNIDTTNERVGIGTNAPGARLDLGTQAPGVDTPFNYLRGYSANSAWPVSIGSVYDLNQVDQYLVLNGYLDGGTKAAPTFTGSGNGGSYIRDYRDGTATTAGMIFGVMGSGAGQTPTAVMKLNQNGNVGIGTIAPETKLEVTGTASGDYVFGQLGLGASGAVVIEKRAGTNTGNTLIVDTKGLVYDATNKRVGIGTTAPETKLEVVGTASGNFIFGQQGLGASGAVVIEKRAGTATGNTLIVDTKGLIYDATNKRVGIGTASPGYKLTVTGDISVDGAGNAFYLDGSDGISEKTMYIDSADDNLHIKAATGNFTGYKIFFDNAASATKVTFDTANGNVGIGTTAPGNKLSVSGSVLIGNNLAASKTADTQLEVVGTVSGSALTVSNLVNCNTIDTDAAGNLVCGTDEGGVGGGLTAAQADNIFVNQGGDTMTGALAIRPTTAGEAALEVAGTASGRILSFGDRLTGSGSVSIRTLTNSVTAFQVFSQAGTDPVFNVDTVNNRVGIRTASPENPLEVVGTMSGSVVHAEQGLTSSGNFIVAPGKTMRFNGVTYTFPASDGTASGKVLKTNSAGQLSWSSDNGGGVSGGTSGSLLVSQGLADAGWRTPVGGLVWYIDGYQAVGTSLGATVPLPIGMTVTSVSLNISGAPTGAALIVDVNKNGTTIFSTRPQINDGQTTGGTGAVLSVTNLPVNSLITIDVDQVGSTYAGSNLTITINGVRKY